MPYSFYSSFGHKTNESTNILKDDKRYKINPAPFTQKSKRCGVKIV